MCEKHRDDRGGEQDDLIEQIITQGLEMINAPVEETPVETAPSAPGQEDSGGEDAPPTNRKNGSPAVFFYLTILLSAAFLMALLACFAQRRSHENAIRDLRDAMDLSREELLDKIKGLEEQKDALNEELQRWKDGWKDDFAQWQKLYEEKVQEANDLQYQIDDAWNELYAWQSFWVLERYYQAGDLENCAAVFLVQEHQFFYRTPEAAQERYEEIVQALIDAGVLYVDMPLI